jgi:hypothetical protein
VKTNLWRLYNLATGYGQRPSDFFELETDLARWMLDETCLAVGRQCEKLIQDGKDPFEDGLKSKTFRSAKGHKIKKVKFKADGTI